MVDALNLLDLSAVPMAIALDKHGVVRAAGQPVESFLEQFINTDYTKDGALSRSSFQRAEEPNCNRMLMEIDSSDPRAWRGVADAYFHNGGALWLNRAISTYRRTVKMDESDARARFRLGVALQHRSESLKKFHGDAQAAIEQWGLALAMNPDQYIWRRRLQQYGPRSDKPYNFYFWIDQARKEIRQRGDEPVALDYEPTASEMAPPTTSTDVTVTVMLDRDPEARIQQDATPLVEIESVVTPAVVAPGKRIRVRVEFRLHATVKPFWNNEAEDLSVWIDLPTGFALGEGRLTFPNPTDAESQERRTLEFELVVPTVNEAMGFAMRAYALYYVCEKKSGKCRYLRQEFTINPAVDPSALDLR